MLILTMTTRRKVSACWLIRSSYDARGSAGIDWERAQIVSDVRGASSKRVKIERKLFSGKGLVIPNKSTTSSSRFGRKNG